MKKISPDLKGLEIGGAPNGEPITLAAGEPVSSKETARRLLLLFNNADREILAEAEARGPAVAPAAAFSSAFSPNGQDRAGQPEGASGGLDTPEVASDSPGAAEADDGGEPAEDEDVVLPIPVESDHAIDWGGKAMIRCQGTDDRTGLVSYALLDHVGRQIRYFSDESGFQRAVELCEKQHGKLKCRYVRPPA